LLASNRVRYIPSVGAVDSDLIDLRRILAEILDVAEYMAATVLADEVAEVCTQTHVCHGGLVVAPFLDREAFE
jgi:hypothetical protein